MAIGYVDAMMSGIHWDISRPTNPMVGAAYFDVNTHSSYIWDGTTWVLFSYNQCEPRSTFDPIPTIEELEKYPALKEAWEAYIIVKKLIGKK